MLRRLLMQVQRLEHVGLSRSAAEELTVTVTELIVLNKAKMEEAFVTTGMLDKVGSYWVYACWRRWGHALMLGACVVIEPYCLRLHDAVTAHPVIKAIGVLRDAWCWQIFWTTYSLRPGDAACLAWHHDPKH